MAKLLLSSSDSGRRANGYAILQLNLFLRGTTGAAVGDIVRFESVGMRYRLGVEVLHDISFFVGSRVFTFLDWPSGAGKSSIMRLMYLAYRPSRGSISVFGRDVSTVSRAELAALRRRIGVVFQDFRLLDHLTALDNVALPFVSPGRRKARFATTSRNCCAGLGWKNKVMPSRQRFQAENSNASRLHGR